MPSNPMLKGRIVVVTGASRGIGRGIATYLGKEGATVYVTARPHNGRGPIDEVADEITASGGEGIALRCDHGDDAQVKALFDHLKSKHGYIDLLVNNATTIPENPLAPPPFWQKSIHIGDQITVGLRSAFVASFYAARLLIQSSRGLIVNISYYGAVSYHLDPAYGATKAGLDKLTFDMAQDFKPYGVAVVSLWPGPTATERSTEILSKHRGGAVMLERSETLLFSGRIITALYTDPLLMKKTGYVVIGAEAALEYGFTDLNGRQPGSLRDQKG